MQTNSRVQLPSRSSSSAVIPDDELSVAGGPNESGNEFGFRDATENADEIAAAEKESGSQRHTKEKEDGAPKQIKYTSWEKRFNELAVYKEKNGNCNISQSQDALGKWVDTQRQFYKKEKLSQERTTQLEGIDFNWALRQKSDDDRWEERFNELAVYKEKNGNCNVPKSHGTLRNWVMTQRAFCKKGKLSQERTTQLEGIDFNWSVRKKNEDQKWEQRFNELAVYKKKNGNCNVPQRHGTLGSWVIQQRQLCKKGKLSRERTTQLEGIEFNWSATRKENEDKQWEDRFNELAVYKEKNCDCNVPSKHGALGSWVYRQRDFYKKGKLSRERITQLEGIGFVWKLKKSSGNSFM